VAEYFFGLRGRLKWQGPQHGKRLGSLPAGGSMARPDAISMGNRPNYGS
jgi:hypothetical protein